MAGDGIAGVAVAADTAEVRRVARTRGSLPVPLRTAAAVVHAFNAACVVGENGVFARIAGAVLCFGRICG